jgi:hypothetical protein
MARNLCIVSMEIVVRNDLVNSGRTVVCFDYSGSTVQKDPSGAYRDVCISVNVREQRGQYQRQQHHH